MKKTIALILVLLMSISGTMAVFAADEETPGDIPKDVKGTVYESAVRTLISKDILSGYGDGTFRPDATMDRAEACAIIVKAMNPLGADLYNAQENTFSDMEGYEWALKYVNYAVAKGVVSGVGNNHFKPADKVTYNEMAAMLVNAVGYTAKDLEGTWPDNYVNKAKELMIFSDATLNKSGDSPATRGDVALMAASVVEKIEVANKSSDPIEAVTTGGAIDNGSLTDASGRYFGMILSSTRSSVRFLMGNRIFDLAADGTVIIPDAKTYLGAEGNLYCLKLKDGVIKGIDKDGTALGSSHFVDMNVSKKLETVISRDKTTVSTAGSGSYELMDSTVYYIAQFNETTGKIEKYVPGTIRDVEKGSKIHAYDLTDDDRDAADVAVVVKSADVDKLR